MMRMTLRIGFVAATLFVSAQTSQAAVLTVADPSDPITWSFNTGTSTLDGTGTISATGFNSSTLTLTVTLTNNADLTSERLTAFGFGITPNATAVSFSDAADGGMEGASLGANFPSVQDVEVCAYGGSNCAGGANGGIAGAGGSDTFQIILTGTWGSSVTIDPIAFKYQTGYGSFEFGPTTTTTTTTTNGSGASSNLPEPGTSALLLLGFGAASLAVKRRRAA